jgi:peroxiredoxin Q/BCP
MPLNLNQQAPDFTLASSSGKMFTLSKDMLNKPCILYFYPKDFTPGCTKEACEFRDTFAMFRDLQITVIGVSRDDVNTHLEFKKQYKLPFDLLADIKGEVADLYDVSMPIIKFTRRTTYLLDKTHRIAAVYTNLFAAEKHIQTMIEEVKSGILSK